MGADSFTIGEFVLTYDGKEKKFINAIQYYKIILREE